MSARPRVLLIAMKKIECVLREEKLEVVLESLKIAGVPGVTVTRVEGFGRQRLIEEMDLKPKVKIEIYLENDQLDHILEVLLLVGRIGKIGDGKIAVLDVQELLRIRTGERAQAAL